MPHSSRTLRGVGKGRLAPKRRHAHLHQVRVVHLHHPCFSELVIAETAPVPLLRRPDQSSLHGIAVNLSNLFDPLLFRPHVVVVKTSLPDVSRVGWISQGGGLCPFRIQHGLGKPLLYDLHDFRWISNLRFRDQEMEVFGHDHVGTYDEAMRFPSLSRMRRNKSRRWAEPSNGFRW